jgi:hypothetical protein
LRTIEDSTRIEPASEASCSQKPRAFLKRTPLSTTASDTFFKGIGTCSLSSSSLTSGILLRDFNLSPFAGSAQCTLSANNTGIPASQLLVIRKMHLTTRSLNNAASANGAEEMKKCLSIPLLRRSASLTIWSNRSCPDVTVTGPVIRHERSSNRFSILDPGPAKVSVLTIFKFKAIVRNLIS